MDWQKVAHEFIPDGSLRDIYVLGADVSDWQRVLDALRTSAPALAYEVGRVPRPLPSQIAEIFAQWEHEQKPLLRFDIAGVTLVCHFFTPNEIEFDLRPDEVSGPNQLEPLVGFLRMLGTTTTKTVILTPENDPQSPIFRFDPRSGRVEYMSPSAI